MRREGLAEDLLAALPATPAELDALFGLPYGRAGSVLRRLYKQGRVVPLGATVQDSGRLRKIWGRPEHLYPPKKRRKPL